MLHAQRLAKTVFHLVIFLVFFADFQHKIDAEEHCKHDRTLFCVIDEILFVSEPIIADRMKLVGRVIGGAQVLSHIIISIVAHNFSE